VPGGYSFDRLRDELDTRIKSIAEFRHKVVDSRNVPVAVPVADPDSGDVSKESMREGQRLHTDTTHAELPPRGDIPRNDSPAISVGDAPI
jgi:hypothetical protein